MRNKFAGACYRCGQHVAPGEGHFERHGHGWRTQHADCAIKARAEKHVEMNLAAGAKYGAQRAGGQHE